MTYLKSANSFEWHETYSLSKQVFQQRDQDMFHHLQWPGCNQSFMCNEQFHHRASRVRRDVWIEVAKRNYSHAHMNFIQLNFNSVRIADSRVEWRERDEGRSEMTSDSGWTKMEISFECARAISTISMGRRRQDVIENLQDMKIFSFYMNRFPIAVGVESCRSSFHPPLTHTDWCCWIVSWIVKKSNIKKFTPSIVLLLHPITAFCRLQNQTTRKREENEKNKTKKTDFHFDKKMKNSNEMENICVYKFTGD